MTKMTHQSSSNPKAFYGFAIALGVINIPIAWLILSFIAWIAIGDHESDGRLIGAMAALLAAPIEFILAAYAASLFLRRFDRPSGNSFVRFLIIFGIFLIPLILLILLFSN